jgi:surfactin family lipopeptide synthetase C
MNGLDSVDDILALTPLQQGMLFHTLYAPESSVYNLQIEFALEGCLDEAALEQAWRTVVERHTVLRTSFVWKRVEKPYQVVHRQADLNIARHDWSALSAVEQDERRRSCLEEERASLFDLTRPPLMRLALIVLSERKFRLVWTFHHIILEGWSAAIILNELWKCYGDLRAHRSPDLPAVRPYAEFIRWLQQKDQSTAKAYWRERLHGFSAPTRLAMDRSKGSAPAEVKRVDSCSFTLSKGFADALKGFARTHRVTLNTVVQGAWSILLSRYSGDQDVVFGAVLSGRPPDLPGVESIVGLFVNTLPARVNVDADATLIPWLQALQLDQATMRQHEHSSLMEVRGWSDVPGGQPLFHTALAFQNWLGEFPSGQMTPDLMVTGFETQEGSDQPLTLQVVMGDTLTLNFMYDVERFDRAAVERLLTHCRILLEAMAAHPQARLKELPFLIDAERHQLLVEWNETKTDYPADAPIHQLFEAQARSTPDAVAVEYEGRQLTYGELNARANQVAHYLARHGAGPELMVGICVERSLEMVAGILGVLKAGAAYVPLDPDYPASRLTFMLDDTAAPLLLTQARLRDRLSGYKGRTVSLDSDWSEIARESQDDPQVRVNARNLAYVMYTSGSTGRPKGTCIEHRSVVRLVKSTNYVELGPQDVFLQFAPLAFDASTFELWGSLLHGARLVVCRAGALSLEELAGVLRDRKVTTLWLTAALFHQMVDEQIESLRGVRQLLAGGETLSVSHVRRMLEVIGRGRLINGYGPTENTTFTCCHVMTTDSRIGPTVPIGRPISNTRVYVLDRHMRPVPIDVYGELYIGGDGLAREYLHQPELTSEKFVADPFSSEVGARLYRSGDRVRFRADGNIEFLGRGDNQVKIRGFRIELGEIEATLNQHPLIRESVVVARKDPPGDKRLVAYIVPNQEPAPAISELRSFLRERLPDYLVPAAYVLVDSLPLTLNGKVDRRALPNPGQTEQHERNKYAAPQDETERVLCRVWSEVLGVQRVGLDDDFFALGGHSLLAAKLFTRLDEEFGRSLPLGVLFAAPTVRSLAGHYRTSPGLKKGSAVVALRAGGTLQPLFAVPGVYGNVVGFANLARELGSEQPFYGLQSVGLDGTAAPLDSIEAMATLYVTEIRSVQVRGPYAIIGACFGATVAYEMARQLLEAGEEIAFLGLLSPTDREGNTEVEDHTSVPRAYKRSAALLHFVTKRSRLYLAEMRRLPVRARFRYLIGKGFSLIASTTVKNRLRGAKRELNQIEVYRANLVALDRYHRKPLDGRLRALEIIEPMHSGDGPQERLDWSSFWNGDPRLHYADGKNSGDMLSGRNARVVADLLVARLQAAFDNESLNPVGLVSACEVQSWPRT